MVVVEDVGVQIRCWWQRMRLPVEVTGVCVIIVENVDNMKHPIVLYCMRLGTFCTDAQLEASIEPDKHIRQSQDQSTLMKDVVAATHFVALGLEPADQCFANPVFVVARLGQ
jgi:hypothetical protein